MWIKRTSAYAMLALLALVGGSVLAPLSHYAFMAMSDVYAAAGSHDGHHAGHHATPPVAGASWEDTGAPLVTCDYASLFATFAAAFVPVLAVSPVPQRIESVPLSPAQLLSDASPLVLLARGPPPVPVHA